MILSDVTEYETYSTNLFVINSSRPVKVRMAVTEICKFMGQLKFASLVLENDLHDQNLGLREHGKAKFTTP